MMSVNGCSEKKRKRKLYNFNTFPDLKSFNSPFCNNIINFVKEFAEIEDKIDGILISRTRLIHNNKEISLYTLEEGTKELCDYCRNAGWSNHFSTKRRYHLIIPKDEWNKPLDSEIFNLQNNLLYGLIHCNGFGHLLCINGREGGSKFLYGKEIMDLWDRICTSLCTRKITVQDLSLKRGMHVRLLHGIAYGRPWFGTWGYKFCKGSFGVTEIDYTMVINPLRSMELKLLSAWRSDVRKIISWYTNLDSSLNNLGDLLRFMLTLEQQGLPTTSATDAARGTPAKGEPEKKAVKDIGRLENFTANVTQSYSRWPKEEVERMELFVKMVVDALRKRNTKSGACNRGMSKMQVWEIARVYFVDIARVYFGEISLVDDVLDLLNNAIVGDYIVCCDVNPQTLDTEYRIREVNQSDQGLDFLAFASAKKQALVPGNDVSSDINYLHNVLRTCKDSKAVGLAVKTIMNAKIFVKEWPFVDKSEELRSLICRVRPGLDELECKFTRGYPPGEHIVISQYSTVGEIKVAVQSAIRETYHIMDRATVIELEGEGVSDEVVLSDIVGSELWFKVNDIDFENELMYEGGKDIINMKCICKATDFDGERIGVCDECKVWQHTRCSGVDMSKKYSACATCLSLKQVDVPNITHDIFD